MRKAADISSSIQLLNDKVEQLTAMVGQLKTSAELVNNEQVITLAAQEGLINIKQIMRFQGYTDARSTKKWLAKNNIIMITIGKRTYISSESWNNYLASKVPVNNKLTDFNNSYPEADNKKMVKKNKKRSKAAMDFLSSIKSL